MQGSYYSYTGFDVMISYIIMIIVFLSQKNVREVERVRHNGREHTGCSNYPAIIPPLDASSSPFNILYGKRAAV